MKTVPVSRQLHDIPPSPRQVRWAAVLWRRWPLALGGFVMAIFGGLVTLMLSYHRAGSAAADDERLDLYGRDTSATVTAITPSPANLDNGPAVRVAYRFLPPSQAASPPAEPIDGSVLAVEGQFEEGRQYPVRYVPGAAYLNRLHGTRLSQLGDLVSPFLGFVVLPGALLLLLWLRSVLDLKHLLAAGDVAVGEVVSLTQVPIVNPAMLRVHYRFRGRHAEPEEGWHWVRARSRLGQHLQEAQRSRVVVVHDRRRPNRSRIVLPEDFCRRTPDQENWQGELSRPA